MADTPAELPAAARAACDAALDPRHAVEFSRTGYGLQHPLACRPDLLRCPVHLHLAARRRPDMPPGRYLVAVHRGRAAYEPTELADPLSPLADALARLRAILDATPATATED